MWLFHFQLAMEKVLCIPFYPMPHVLRKRRDLDKGCVLVICHGPLNLIQSDHLRSLAQSLSMMYQLVHHVPACTSCTSLYIMYQLVHHVPACTSCTSLSSLYSSRWGVWGWGWGGVGVGGGVGGGEGLGVGSLHMLRSLWCAAHMGHFGGPQSPYIWVHFWWNVLRRIGSYIWSSSLQLGSKLRISSDFGNQRYLIGVIDTGFISRVMRLPPGDYCNGWLGMGDDKMLGGGPWG